MKIQKIFLKSMVLFLALSAIFGIFSVLTGVFDKFLVMILITTFSLGVYSLTGLCCAPMLNRPELRALGICGIAASILGGGFVIVTNLLLFYLSDHVKDGVFILIGRFLFLIIAIAIAHISLLMRIKTNHSLVIIARWCTIAAITVVALHLLSLTLNFKIMEESWRLFLIFGILNVAGTIATPILHLITKDNSN